MMERMKYRATDMLCARGHFYSLPIPQQLSLADFYKRP
jgi:hypothetical protein